jgi:hypothetical protein
MRLRAQNAANVQRRMRRGGGFPHGARGPDRLTLAGLCTYKAGEQGSARERRAFCGVSTHPLAAAGAKAPPGAWIV